MGYSNDEFFSIVNSNNVDLRAELVNARSYMDVAAEHNYSIVDLKMSVLRNIEIAEEVMKTHKPFVATTADRQRVEIDEESAHDYYEQGMLTYAALAAIEYTDTGNHTDFPDVSEAVIEMFEPFFGEDDARPDFEEIFEPVKLVDKKDLLEVNDDTKFVLKGWD